MVDIDLEFLNFLLNPTYEYLKEKIDWIRCEYIYEYGEEYRKKIENNFSKVNYVFMDEAVELEKFINTFLSNIIEECYINLAKHFHIEIIVAKDLNTLNVDNFIEEILVKSSLKRVRDDGDLSVFGGKIRDYLVNLENNCYDEKEKFFLNEQIFYIDSAVKRFQDVLRVFQPKLDLLKDACEKKKSARKKWQERFLLMHSDLFSYDEFFQLMRNVNDLALSEFSKEGFYIRAVWDNEVFSLGSILAFQPEFNDASLFLKFRKKILIEAGIDVGDEDIDLSNPDECLKRLGVKFEKDGITYFGLSALNKLDEEIQAFNKSYKEEIKEFQWLLPKSDFIKKNICSKEFFMRSCHREIVTKGILGILSDSDYKYIGDLYF